MIFLKKRLLSFKYAIKGLKWVIATQPNLWIHIGASVCVIILAMYFKITKPEWIIITACIAFVFMAELFNTTIEWLVDSIYKERHPVAGKIKDVAASAVLMVAIGVAIIGVIIFYPYSKELFL